MATSRRQQIVDAVKARFETISIANGYETDIGATVALWRDTINVRPADTDLPLLNILDRSCQSSNSSFAIRKQEHRLTIEVELWTASSTVDTTIRKMLADLAKAIGVDRKWGGIADNTEPLGDDIGVEQQGRKIAGALYKFVIVYHTNAWDPYNVT